MNTLDRAQIAECLKMAKPADFLTNAVARQVWCDCVLKVGTVCVDGKEPGIVKQFWDNCGVPE